MELDEPQQHDCLQDAACRHQILLRLVKPRDLAAASLVCSSWRATIVEEKAWDNAYMQSFNAAPEEYERRQR
jgi:hypothetical protein